MLKIYLKNHFILKSIREIQQIQLLIRVDIFWILPCNLLLMNGGHDAAKKAFKNIKPILKTDLKK